MGLRHRPNQKKDKRKPRIKHGVCTIANCSRPSAIIYYDCPLCSTCFDYYSDLDDSGALKRVLGIKEKVPEVILDPFEEDMFT